MNTEVSNINYTNNYAICFLIKIAPKANKQFPKSVLFPSHSYTRGI